MASLATALKASGTEYSDGLTYRPGMALRSANCAALEKGGMQVMTFYKNNILLHTQWDTNPQSPDLKSGALSSRPWSLLVTETSMLQFTHV